MCAALAPERDPIVAVPRVRAPRELASGVDALYLSGECAVSEAMETELLAVRGRAQAAGGPLPYRFSSADWNIAPYGLTRYYPVRLEHEFAAVGVSFAERIPTLRVQARAEALHAIGADNFVGWCEARFAPAFGQVMWKVSRIDVFADWQDWSPVAADSLRYVSRARARESTCRRSSSARCASWTSTRSGS